MVYNCLVFLIRKLINGVLVNLYMLHIYHTSETNLLEFTDRVTGLAHCCLVAGKTEEKLGNRVVMLLRPSVVCHLCK